MTASGQGPNPDGEAQLSRAVSFFHAESMSESTYPPGDRISRELESEFSDLAVEVALAELDAFAPPPADLRDRLLAEIGPEQGFENPLELLAVEPQEAVVLTNLRGRIEWVSPAFTEMCGYSLSELRGRKPGALLQGGETNAAEVDRIRRAVRAHQPVSAILRNYAKGGQAYWVSLSISPVHGPDGSLRGYIAIEREITPEEAGAAGNA